MLFLPLQSASNPELQVPEEMAFSSSTCPRCGLWRPLHCSGSMQDVGWDSWHCCIQITCLTAKKLP